MVSIAKSLIISTSCRFNKTRYILVKPFTDQLFYCIERNARYQIFRMSSDGRPTVFLTSSLLPQETVGLLKESTNVESWTESYPIPRKELLKAVKGKNGLFCTVLDKIDAELLNSAGPNLKVIGTISVGYDHIDLPECKKRNILVGNTPDVLTDATAELAITLLLATARKIFDAHKKLVSGEWKKVIWAPLYLCGSSIKGATVGIVGLGRIGLGIAERLIPFKVKKILYCGNKPKPEAASVKADFVSFDDLLFESDFVIVSCSFNEQTKELFNKRAFGLMKNTATFINVSRGGVVNQDDLVQALQTNQIKAAGLDVMTPEPLSPDHVLTKLENCTLLPHIGSACLDTRMEMANLTAKNILAGLQGRPLPAPL